MKLGIKRLSRDTVLFVAGLGGIGYETIFQHGDRPTLLILFGAMVGLPAFLRTDELRQGKPASSAAAPVVVAPVAQPEVGGDS